MSFSFNFEKLINFVFDEWKILIKFVAFSSVILSICFVMVLNVITNYLLRTVKIFQNVPKLTMNPSSYLEIKETKN